MLPNALTAVLLPGAALGSPVTSCECSSFFFFFLIFIYLRQVLVSTLGIVASCSLVEVSRLSRSAAYGILL